MTTTQFRAIIFAALFASSLVAAACGSEPMTVYDATKFTDNTSGLPRMFTLTTSETLSSDQKIIDRAKLAKESGGIFHIDIEHVRFVERKYGRKITDRELISLACQKADIARRAEPSLMVGIYLMRSIPAGAFMDNLRGDKDPLGNRARRNLTISADFVSIPAYYWGKNSVERWKEWVPGYVHQYRLACRTRLIVHLNAVYRDGTLVPLDVLREIYGAIRKDADAICWFGNSRDRYNKFMPWSVLSKEIGKGR